MPTIIQSIIRVGAKIHARSRAGITAFG